MFPILLDHAERVRLEEKGYITPKGKDPNPNQIPKQLPMDFVKRFEDQIKKNHDQTLERLAERGGLHPTELCAAMYGMDINLYFGNRKDMGDDQTIFAINLLMLRLNEFNRK